MKLTNVFTSLLSIALLIAVIVAFDSCKGGGDDPNPNPGGNQTEKERVTALLISGQWKIKSLTIDGVAKSDYSKLTISFATATYTSTNGVPVWPTTGSWAFTDDTAKSFNRDDQTVVAIESIDQNNLTMSLTWSQTSLGPGRLTSVAGKHVFVMGK